MEVTVAMLSYNRPAFLQQAVCSMFQNAGMEFEFLLWDNNSDQRMEPVLRDIAANYPVNLYLNNENIGQQAFHYLLNDAKGKYFVLVEDDMIWFQEDWLVKLLAAFKIKPDVTQAGLDIGFKKEWGIVATNCLVDRVNNGGMWKSRFTNVINYAKDGIRYWTNLQAGAGAMIFKTDVIRKLGVFPKEAPKFGQVNRLLKLFDDKRYLMAHARDVYIYHAASPYWNELFEDVWKEKQQGLTIEQAKEDFKRIEGFDFSDPEPKDRFLNGSFNIYAKCLYSDVIHRDLVSYEILPVV